MKGPPFSVSHSDLKRYYSFETNSELKELQKNPEEKAIESLELLESVQVNEFARFLGDSSAFELVHLIVKN